MRSVTRTELDDETLMAYADGELAPEQAAAVEARLAHDPAAQRALEIFVATGGWVRHAFDGALHERVPDHLVTAIGQQPAATILPFRRVGIAPAGRFVLPNALAAGLALLLGLGAGYWLNLPEPGPGGGLLAELDSATVQELAERGTAARQVAIGGGARTAEILATFQAADGRWCRELALVGAENVATAILCRSADAGWLPAAYLARQPGEADGFAPAAGEPDPADVLGAALGAGTPLTPEEERRLIETGWPR